jgi:hypothetical protein
MNRLTLARARHYDSSNVEVKEFTFNRCPFPNVPATVAALVERLDR